MWKAANLCGHALIWKLLGKHQVALIPAHHMVPKFLFEKTYSIVIAKREEWSRNGYVSFGIIHSIIYIDRISLNKRVGGKSVLGKPDYGIGPTSGKDDDHIPGGDIRYIHWQQNNIDDKEKG